MSSSSLGRSALCLRRSKVAVGRVTLKLPRHLSLGHGACLGLDLDHVTGPFCVAPLWQGWNTPAH